MINIRFFYFAENLRKIRNIVLNVKIPVSNIFEIFCKLLVSEWEFFILNGKLTV